MTREQDLPTPLKEFADRTFSAPAFFCRHDTPKYFNIEPAGLVQSLRALALSRRPPHM